MAYLIHGTKHPVVYCANYRTGSTAMAMTLLEMGAENLGKHHDPPVVEAQEGNCLVKKIPDNALIVEAVRHHCDVIVSWWMSKATMSCLPKFIRMVLDGCHPALSAIAFYNRFPMSNYILRYETLEFEWETLCCNAGLEYRPLLVKPSKRPKDVKWQNVFPHTLRHEVCERYKDEMERLGYGCY